MTAQDEPGTAGRGAVPGLAGAGLRHRPEQVLPAPGDDGAAQNTRLAAAGDLCRFLRFLHGSRGGKSWRDAAEEDHAAFLYWRRFDPAGPRVAASTWNRELALVNGFFSWAARQRLVAGNPVPHRARRAGARWQPQGDGPTVQLRRPAAILAGLLGMHVNTAVRWVIYARRDWADYLAARAADSSKPI